VTGGGRGIGRAIASCLVKAGATVTIVGRNPGQLEQAIMQGDAHAAAVADVTDAQKVQSAVQEAVSRYGPIDLMIANAGAAASAPFMKSSPEIFRQMLDVNLLGVTNVAQAVLGSMTERGFGRIIAVASTAGLKGYPYVSAYCAAKHAVVGFVRALALETSKTGITVNAVCPGFTDTDLVAESLEMIMAKTNRTRDEALSELVKHNPQGRLIDPSEVAAAVLWLCSEGARSVTGQAVVVAGGEI
jgi:3-hydroxybutyrate dehydrogenase